MVSEQLSPYENLGSRKRLIQQGDHEKELH